MTYFVSFRHLAEIFWRVYRNGFLWALRIVLKGKKLFEQRSVLLVSFGFRAKQSLEIRQTKSAGMPNFLSIGPKEHFEENNVVQNKISFVFFKFWAISAVTLPKKFWLRSPKCISKVQGNFFHRIFWWSMTYFVSFRHLAEIFWRVYRNGFLWALRIVLKGKKLFEQRSVLLVSFGFGAKQSLEIRQTKSAGMPNFLSISPKEHFEENNFVQNKNSFVFYKFWAISAGTLPKKIWLRSPKCISKVQGNFFHHISWYSMTYFVSFRLLAEIFWRNYRNGFLWVLRIVLKEKTYFEQRSILSKNFGFTAKKN